MIDRILHFSIQHRVLVAVFGLLLVGLGVSAGLQLPIDAVPDVTTNQVQINAVAAAMAPQEIEQRITFPLEVAMTNLPRVEEVRSLSKFGLSQITVIFDDDVDVFFARQLVNERMQSILSQLPEDIHPDMAPISTGLGEIYYVMVESDGVSQELMGLRTVLDWIVKPQLRTVRGVAEVNSFGGLVKQYQVLVDPAKLVSHSVTLRQVFEALAKNNLNAGGAFVLRESERQIVRSVGLVRDVRDIERIVLTAEHGTPVTVSDVATVVVGSEPRNGALTQDGRESVTGIIMMLKGENSRLVVQRVKDRVTEIRKALPRGVKLTPFLDRTTLVDKTIHTVQTNLVEGGILVIAILFLFLRNVPAALITASAIPLSMLIAFMGMDRFGISANLMSLGAIDFGLIVDGAVVMVENCVRRIAVKRRELTRPLTRAELSATVYDAATEVQKATTFGVIIIIIVYLPIVTLQGIEGKMFKPMAYTVMLALTGALLLSLTTVPALCALFLRRDMDEREPHLLEWTKRSYERLLRRALRHRAPILVFAIAFAAVCAALFPLLGSEFLPEIDEGALALEVRTLPSVSLEEAIHISNEVSHVLHQFPEVTTVVSRVGQAEIAIDPMGPEMQDVMVPFKPSSLWTTARTREELVDKIRSKLDNIPGIDIGFSQPVKMRMMELVEGAGVRSDIGIKIFGEDMRTLLGTANEVARIVQRVRGATDLRVEQVMGLPTLQIKIKRDEIARYGINVSDVQDIVETAIGGKEASEVVEGDKRFALNVRFIPEARSDPRSIGNVLIPAPHGERIPLAQLADITSEEGPAQINREGGRRRIVVECNVRGRDIGSFVEEAQRNVDALVDLPAGFRISWEGTFKHLQRGRARLMIVVPIALFLIFLLLFTTFNNARQAVLVFTGVPLAVTGGVLSLLLRGMHFSMSAGVGFIALFGVAVLNGVVMVTFINQLREQGRVLEDAVIEGALTRLRPVLMTALVASLGFVPMALSHGTGAEVQRPLATVVIGGLITSTILTLFVLPTLYAWFEREKQSEVDTIA